MRSGSRSVSGSIRPVPTPSGPAARPRPSSLRARLATGSGFRTSHLICGTSSAPQSSGRSSPGTPRVRRRTRASAATEASALPSCSRSRAAPAPPDSRRATTPASPNHRGRRLLARARTSARTSRTCSPASIRRSSSRVWFPLGDQTKEETRAEAIRAGLDAAHRPESQEACFLAGADYRDFLGRAGLTDTARRGRRRGRAPPRHPLRPLGLHAWTAPGDRRRRRQAAARPAHRARAQPRRGRRSDPPSRARTSTPAVRCSVPSIARRRSSVTARPLFPPTVRDGGGRFRPRPRRACLRRRAGPGGRPLRRRRGRRLRNHPALTRATTMPGMDEIVLIIPRERPFYGVAHLVLGGLGSRLNLTLEHLEDLQLGLDSLLAQHDGQGDVTLRIRIRDGAIETEIGPFPSASPTARSRVRRRRPAPHPRDGFRRGRARRA